MTDHARLSRRASSALRSSADSSDDAALSTQHPALHACGRTQHSALQRAIFLDKDGTLVEDVPFNCDVSRIVLLAKAGEGLRRLQEAGFRLIVVSNQSGVARGYFPESALVDIEIGLRRLLAEEGIRLDGFFCCPHDPVARVSSYAVACVCRKPAPGLLERAAADQAVDLARSWMIGDILHDVEAGRRAGCRTILIDNGHETEWKLAAFRWPDLLAPDLAAAAEAILAHDRDRMESVSHVG